MHRLRRNDLARTAHLHWIAGMTLDGLRNSFLAAVCMTALISCSPEGKKPPPPATAANPRRWNFAESGVVFDADFPRARLNGCEAGENGTFDAVIRPENAPINDSPWFAFKVS